MRQLLLLGALMFSAALSQAAYAKAGLDPQSKKLPVDVVITGLRQVGDTLRGPIEIHNSHQETKIFLDNNICTVDGACTEMAPIVVDATLTYVGQSVDSLYYSVTANSGVQTLEELKNPIQIILSKNNLKPQVLTVLNKYVANSYVWMTKYDGAITCDNSSGVSEFEMYEELEKENIFAQSFAKAHNGLIMPTVCGIKSGSLNAYLINTDDVDAVKALGFDVFSQRYPSGEIIR